MVSDESVSCNQTRLDCFSQKEIAVAGAVNAAAATDYTVNFTVPHPGWFGFELEWQDGSEGGRVHRVTDLAQLLIGPGLPDLTKSWFAMTSDRHDAKEGHKLVFEVVVLDQDGDPRFGLDEVIVQLVRLSPDASALAEVDKGLQPQSSLKITLMTRRSREDALRSGAVSGPIGLIPTGSSGGRFTIPKEFEEGSKGVFRMRTWVCPPAFGNLSCTMEPKNEILQPNEPGSSDVPEMIFTVCQHNASIDDAVNIDAARSALSQCKCDRGYAGPDGVSCTACSAGQYKAEPGQRACSPCTAGTHCDCLSNPKYVGESDSGSHPCTNPCTKCDACPINYYQHEFGKKTCTACPNDGVGFICPLVGMTWPIARPGYWISGSNPTIFHDVSLCTFASRLLEVV